MAGPNMKRDETLAGQSVKQGNYTVTYNEHGYAVSAKKDGGKSATSTKKTTQANASPTHQAAYQAAQSGDWDKVGSLVNNLATPDGYGGMSMAGANDYMRELQDEFGYNDNDYYRGKYDAVYGQGAWDGGTGTGQPVYNDYSQALYQAAYQAANGAAAGGSAGASAANPYAGTNYHADAIKYAQAGDWENALAALKMRDEKTMNTGQNYGKNSSDILQSLLNQFGVKTENYNGFEYEAAPQYYDDYQVKIDAALDKLLNRDAFSYNPEEDEAFQSYRDMYTREGDRAMRDTLGQVAARTGGMASSYAVTAAQQANQYYMQQLADKVPELRNLAYQMYLDDINLQAQDLGLLQNASSEAYSRYQDTLDSWRNDRDFAYGNYRDNIADERYDTEWQYQLDRDALADTRYDTEWNYQLSRDQVADSRYDKEWAYQVEQDRLAAQRAAAQQSTNRTPSYADEVTAVAAFLGISEKEANALKNIGSSMYTDALKEIGVGGNNDNPELYGDGSAADKAYIDSVAELAGPRSADYVAEKLRTGEWIEYKGSDGYTRVKKNPNYNYRTDRLKDLY